MKILGRTLAIIAFLTLTAQTVRHAYLLWLEPRDSALDKYDRPLKGEILKARSLDELLRRYEPVRKEADRVKQQQRDADRRPLEACERLTATIQELETSHGAALRMVIRWSGTEPKLRLMVEAKKTELMNQALGALELAARADLGLE